MAAIWGSDRHSESVKGDDAITLEVVEMLVEDQVEWYGGFDEGLLGQDSAELAMRLIVGD